MRTREPAAWSPAYVRAMEELERDAMSYGAQPPAAIQVDPAPPPSGVAALSPLPVNAPGNATLSRETPFDLITLSPATRQQSADPRIAGYYDAADRMESGSRTQGYLSAIASLGSALATKGRAPVDFTGQWRQQHGQDVARADRYRATADSMAERQAHAEREAVERARLLERQRREDERRESVFRDEGQERARLQSPLSPEQVQALTNAGLDPALLTDARQADLPTLRAEVLRQQGRTELAAQNQAAIAARQKSRGLGGGGAGGTPAVGGETLEGSLLAMLPEGAPEELRVLAKQAALETNPKRQKAALDVFYKSAAALGQQEVRQEKQAQVATAAETDRSKQYEANRQKFGLPNAEAALQHLDDVLRDVGLVDKNGSWVADKDVPGFGTAAGLLPDALITEEGEKLRLAHDNMRQQLLAALSGAGVSDKERDYYDRMLGAAGGSETRFREGIEMVRKRLRRLDQEARGVLPARTPAAAAAAPTGKRIVSQSRSPSRPGKLFVVYEDGSREVIDG